MNLSKSFFRSGLFVVLMVWGLSACATVENKPEQPELLPFEAATYWNSDYGPMRLVISGVDVEGVYPDYKGELKMKVRAAGVLEGFWIQPVSKRRCGFKLDGSSYWGTVRLERISQDKISGQWAYCNESPGSGGHWKGVRIGHPGF